MNRSDPALTDPSLLSDAAELNQVRESWQEFLTPEQRLQIVADILGTIAVRIVKQQDEQINPKP